MTEWTPETVAKVDAWLDGRKSWWMASDDRFLLMGMWRMLADYRAAAKPGERAGIEAAMTGVVLALVREAWGDPSLTSRADGLRYIPWGIRSSRVRMSRVWYSTEAEALLAALEAAP